MRFVIWLWCLALVGCDHRTHLEVVAANKVACEKAGGVPEFVEHVLGEFVRCHKAQESK